MAASYPNGECVFNISKETTSKELLGIENIEQTIQRMQTINLSAGRTNAVEFCTQLYGLPTFDALLEAFTRDESRTVDEGREDMKAELLSMSERMLHESLHGEPTPEDTVATQEAYDAQVRTLVVPRYEPGDSPAFEASDEFIEVY